MSKSLETALYRIYGDGDLLLYIGISKNFGRRWKDEARDFPWWGERHRMTVDWHDSWSKALQAETAAINAENPKYNIRRPSVPDTSWYSPPRAPQPPPSMLTYREAARKLGVSDSFVYRLLREGKIHSVELGPQTLRIPLSECEAYVAALIAEQIAHGNAEVA